jgi:prepilin peptidase CpaA
MFEGWNWIFLLTLALLGASVIDDLRSRKVQNSLVISIFVVAGWSALLFGGTASAAQILSSMLAAVAFCLPLYLMKAVGGGDFKLLIALSPLMNWSEVGWTVAYSLVWGALLGFVMVLLRKEVGGFLQNMKSLALKNPVKKDNLHKLPYTVAILLGFLTQASLAEKGVSLL